MKNKRVLVVCCGGGHLREALVAVDGAVDEFHLATYRGSAPSGIRGMKSLTYLIDPHVSKLKFGLNFLQSLWLWLKVRPNVVITTGAGMAIPSCLIGKALGAKLIVVDTVAAVGELSRTGRFLYKYADLFIVQWPGLLAKYPKAVYGGCAL